MCSVSIWLVYRLRAILSLLPIPDTTILEAFHTDYDTGSRVFIPGLPRIPVIFRSRIPGSGTASFPAKTGTGAADGITVI